MPLSDDLRQLELNQLRMTSALFNVLDHVLSHVVAPLSRVKPGGYPEEIFRRLTELDKEEFECCICYQILKDAKQCTNKHRFCSSCIFSWSVNGPNQASDKCPMCRVAGEYKPCDVLNARLAYRRVLCHLKDCEWEGFLKDYDNHTHDNYTTRNNRKTPDTLPSLPGSTVNPAKDSRRTSMPIAVTTGSGAASSGGGGGLTGSLRGQNSGRSNNLQGNPARRLRNPFADNSIPGEGLRRNSLQASTTPRRTNPFTDNSIPGEGSRRNSQATTSNEAPNSLTPRPPIASRPSGPQPVFTERRQSLIAQRQNGETNSATETSSVTDPERRSSPHLIPLTGDVESTTRLPALPGTISATTTYTTNTTESLLAQPAVQRSHQLRRMGQQIRESRHHLHDIMNLLQNQLEIRRHSIAAHQRFHDERETGITQMHDVQNLGEMLSDVATNLALLMSMFPNERHSIRD